MNNSVYSKIEHFKIKLSCFSPFFERRLENKILFETKIFETLLKMFKFKKGKDVITTVFITPSSKFNIVFYIDLVFELRLIF